MKTYFTPSRYLHTLFRLLARNSHNSMIDLNSVKGRTCEAKIETDAEGKQRIVFLRDTTGEQNCTLKFSGSVH